MEEGVGVVGDVVITLGNGRTCAAEIEVVAVGAVVKPGPSVLTGCLFRVGGC